jgi:molybdopterin converting factor small subunit
MKQSKKSADVPREIELRLTVRLFALARQRAGRPEIVVDVPEPATVGALRRAIEAEFPSLAPLVPNLMIAVASEYAEDGETIPPGAEVAAIPPVSGGGTASSI